MGVVDLPEPMGDGVVIEVAAAGVAFPDPADYAAAKIAIFLASLIAGALGVLILWPRTEAISGPSD